MRNAALVLKDGAVLESRAVSAFAIHAGKACFAVAAADHLEDVRTLPIHAEAERLARLYGEPYTVSRARARYRVFGQGGTGGSDFSGTKKMSVIAWLAFFFDGVSSTRAFGPVRAQPPRWIRT